MLIAVEATGFYALASGENQTVGTDGYYPGDDHRGDVARILFYMITMYDFLSLQSEHSK